MFDSLDFPAFQQLNFPPGLFRGEFSPIRASVTYNNAAADISRIVSFYNRDGAILRQLLARKNQFGLYNMMGGKKKGKIVKCHA